MASIENSKRNTRKKKPWHVGTLKWYGGNGRNKNGESLKYGFIQDLVSSEDVYFNENFIDRDQSLIEFELTAPNELCVMFQVFVSPDGRTSARKVHVIHASAIAAEEILTRISPEILNMPEIRKHLFPKIPEFYLRDHFIDYLRWITDSNIKVLLKKRFEEGFFQESFYDACMSYLGDTTIFLHHWVPFYTDWILAEKPDADQLIALMKLMKSRSLSVLSFLNSVSLTDIEEKGLIPLLSDYELKALYSTNPFDDSEHFSKIAAQIKDPSCYSTLCDYASDKVLLQTISGSFPHIDTAKQLQLLKNIDWNRDDADSLELYRGLLALIEADRYPLHALKIAEGYIQRDCMFRLNWWMLLNPSVKIRCMIYFSNQIFEYQEHSAKIRSLLKEITLAENARAKEDLESTLVLAVLRFLWIAYCDTDKQTVEFTKACIKFQEYIINRFNRYGTVSPGLNTLLEHCFISYQNTDISEAFYFCDGRNWQRSDNIPSVWCPVGEQRPSGGRHECSYLTNSILNTYAKSSEKKEYQTLTDLLSNLHFHDFDQHIANRELGLTGPLGCAEYSHRVSAYVNRLLDMKLHMICRHCGKVLKGNFEYSKKPTASVSMTLFTCEEDGAEHDHNVYLNYCYRCHRVIDSRECRQKFPEETGQYLCMICGGNNLIDKGTMCPSCGTRSGYVHLRGDFIYCEKPGCGYDSSQFWHDSNANWEKIRPRFEQSRPEV